VTLILRLDRLSSDTQLYFDAFDIDLESTKITAVAVHNLLLVSATKLTNVESETISPLLIGSFTKCFHS